MCLVRSAAAAMNSSGEAISLPAGGVVLADPGLVVAEVSSHSISSMIAADGQRRIVAGPMERRQEDAENHSLVRHAPLSCLR